LQGAGNGARYRLVILLEILETSAEAFWRLSSILGQFMIRLEANQVTDQILGIATGALGDMQREINRLKLASASKQLDRIKIALIGDESERKTLVEIRSMLEELHLRVLDELDDRFFSSYQQKGFHFISKRSRYLGQKSKLNFHRCLKTLRKRENASPSIEQQQSFFICCA
jgi:hypothetical protein